jgi:alpha-mannosidase
MGASPSWRDYYDRRLPLDEWRVRRVPVEGGESPSLDDSTWDIARVGQGFTGPRERFWFRRRVVVPPEFAGRPVALSLKLADQHTIAGAEGLVYVDGQPIQGIDRNHSEVLLAERGEAGREYAVAIYGFVGMFRETLMLREAALVTIDRPTESFYFGALAALQVVGVRPAESFDRVTLLNALDESENLVDWRFPGSAEFYSSVARADELLRARLYEHPSTCPRPKVTLVGHSHIDVAWLWTLAVTREKCGRTFSTVLKLMDQYPEYRFTQSQPQLY